MFLKFEQPVGPLKILGISTVYQGAFKYFGPSDNYNTLSLYSFTYSAVLDAWLDNTGKRINWRHCFYNLS